MTSRNYNSLNGQGASVSAEDIRARCRCGNSGCSCRTGRGNVHCPCHDDQNPSMSVQDGMDGKILLKCFAGCSQDTLVDYFKRNGLWFDQLRTRPVGSSTERVSAQSARTVQGVRLKAGEKITGSHDYRDKHGELQYQIVRISTPTGKRFLQRRPHEGGWVCGLAEGWYQQSGKSWYRIKDGGHKASAPHDQAIWLEKVEPILYKLPDIDNADLVYIVEGEACADVLNAKFEAEGIEAIATTCTNGAGKWRSSYCDYLVDKEIVVLPDNDAPGHRHGEKVCALLAPVAASLKTVMLPGLPSKGDVVDWFEQGKSATDIIGLARKVSEWCPSPAELETSGRVVGRSDNGITKHFPTIIISDRQFRTVSEEALNALVKANDPPQYFVRGRQLTLVSHDSNGKPQITFPSAASLRGVLSLVADWKKINDRGATKNVFTPRDLAEVMLAYGEWPGIPELAGIVTAPVVAPDGSICTQPGYDPATRLYYDGPEFDLSATIPTSDNIASAKRMILEEWWGDFPFASPSSQAHALALVLLPFVRPLITGPTPLHLVDAPAPGTGKSLLGTVSAQVFAGRPVAAMTLGRSGEEMRKRLTSKLMQAPTHIFFDNVERLDSADLAAALTAEVWDDRILGRSQNISIPINAVWMATSNNALLSQEMVRRAIWIRLDAQVEKPYLRRGFRHNSLTRWTREQRDQLVVAILTLIRAWVQAGQPDYSGTFPAPGSYEEWSRVIGGIIETIGVDGFLANAEKLYNQTEGAEGAFYEFIEAWHRRFGEGVVGVKELLCLARENINDELGDQGDRSQAIRLGQTLRRNVDRVYGEYRLEQAGERQRAVQYRIRRSARDVNESGECGESGECSSTESARTLPVAQSDGASSKDNNPPEDNVGHPDNGQNRRFHTHQTHHIHNGNHDGNHDGGDGDFPDDDVLEYRDSALDTDQGPWQSSDDGWPNLNAGLL